MRVGYIYRHEGTLCDKFFVITEVATDVNTCSALYLSGHCVSSCDVWYIENRHELVTTVFEGDWLGALQYLTKNLTSECKLVTGGDVRHG